MLSHLLLLASAVAAVTASAAEKRTIPRIYLSDIANCGSRLNSCRSSDPNAFATCTNGNCGTSCYSDCFLSKFGTCQPNLPSSCGTSGQACRAPKSNGQATCTQGVCGVTCNANTVYNAATNDCEASCTKDVCGLSGRQCVDPANGDANCYFGVCTYTCNSGYQWNSITSQCEKQATGYGPTRCPILGGFLGTENCVTKYAGLQNGAALCTVAGCVYSCNTGYQSKNYLSSNGLLSSFFGGGSSYGCIETTQNRNCCGSSGTVCKDPANGDATCQSGSCVYTCNDGYDWDDSSKQCVAVNTPQQCGRCGNKCFAPQNGSAQCIGGQCSWTCNTGYVKNGNCCVLSATGKAGTLRKRTKSSGADKFCPAGEQACPIAGSASLEALRASQGPLSQAGILSAIQQGSIGYECVDTKTSIESCGGCSSTGAGKDCSAIPNALGVGCQAGQCVILDCAPGYHRSSNGQSCQRASAHAHKRHQKMSLSL